jgi:hypothetical protein
MSHRARTSILASVLATSIVSTGCKSLDCGEGTIERDGVCSPADDNPGSANCGPFTMLENGVCVPMFDPTICDPGTTEEILDPDTGVITCQGTGAGDCSAPLSGCDVAAPNTMTVCGRIYDVEDDTVVGMGSADTGQCPMGGEANGSCALVIRPYDALLFAGNPTGTMPLNAAEIYHDRCGRFRMRDIVLAGAPFVGLGVAPHPAQGSTNRLTGVAFPSQNGGALRDVVAYTTRMATDMMWTSTAGEGTSLATQGVYVHIYRANGTTNMPLSGAPATGVTITQGGSALPNDDYYFSDSNPSQRTTLVEDPPTGATGTGLILRQPDLNPYSGMGGGLPGGCNWYTSMGATIGGVVFVQIHNPVGASCP